MRILAVGAHPDDLEFLCAGTLAKFKEKKAEIFMSYLCNGDKGHFEIPSPELARIRKKEAENSADYMCDHTTTSKLVIDASFIATLPNYKTEHKPHTLIPPIFFMDTLAGVDFIPTEYVDITDFIDTKEKMLLCHQSQYKWLKEHDGIDYIDSMRKVASFRGLQCGVPYAEGFRAYSVWGRIKAKRLLP